MEQIANLHIEKLPEGVYLVSIHKHKKLILNRKIQ